MNKIQSKDHDIATYRISKIYLPCCDNKKHVLEDGYSRLSHFYKSTHFSRKSNFVKYWQFILIVTLNTIDNYANIYSKNMSDPDREI